MAYGMTGWDGGGSSQPPPMNQGRSLPSMGMPQRGMAGGGMTPQLMAFLAFLTHHFGGLPQAGEQPILHRGRGSGGGWGVGPEPISGGALSGVPRFAQGGYVTKPTLAMIGDAGPEAVVPMTTQPPSASSPPSSLSWGKPIQTLHGPPPGMGEYSPGVYSYRSTPSDITSALLNWQGRGMSLGPFGSDPRITAMLRSQAIQDAAAQGRSTRLGLLGNASVDPSTFGFQSLMSDLQGQGQVAGAVNASTLQQQLLEQEFIRKLLTQQSAQDAAIQAAREGRPPQPVFDWGGALAGAGALASAF